MSDILNPDTYKRSCVEETKNHSLEDIFSTWDNLIPENEWEKYEEMTMFLVECNPQTPREFEKSMVKLRRKFKCLPKKSHIIHVFNSLMIQKKVDKSIPLKQLLVKKQQKSQSGVLVVTVLTSPYPTVGKKKQRFSCQWNCYYCPNEPDQPRSYLHDEPSVLRANRNDFDPVLQFCDRVVTLAINGHPLDKIELLILGGTWASYPVEYQESFIRDLFYAANTFYERCKRERKSLDEEKLENEKAIVKIIGITLETRPDCINVEELKRFRRYGCTRVQLGLQHTSNEILSKINRGCTNEDAIKAIKLLRDCCYKTDIHLMPNLPGSTVEMDRQMFEEVLFSTQLHADQWKIYPCEVTPWTVIKKWYDEGTYQPYEESKLIELLIDVKSKVHPWIRLNRVIRDIPSQYILGGMDAPNLRQHIGNVMNQRGLRCKCIRCREVKSNTKATEQAVMKVRTYEANEGLEYFISMETPDEHTICGFVRLRISSTAGANIFPELENSALIRELHVYGQMKPTTNKEKDPTSQQHTGFGKRLMAKAEEVALKHQMKRMAVISGVGVRNFYRQIGFEMEGEGEFMIKSLNAPNQWMTREFYQSFSTSWDSLRERISTSINSIVNDQDISQKIIVTSSVVIIVSLFSYALYRRHN